MQIFKISNSHLARSIHVDPSLVSRWKSGSRKISAHSPHIAALATFFVHLEAYPYQKDYLNRLLSQLLHQNPDNVAESDRSLALASWLVSPDSVLTSAEPDKLLFSEHSKKLFSQINQWLTTGPDKPVPSGSRRQAEPSIPATASAAQPFCGQLYYGLAGKRQAVIDFLDLALAMKGPLEFLLFSEELMDWLTEDPGFLSLWGNRLRQVLEQGHTITIIHVVNRSAQEIIRIINQWLPLHLSGQIRSYYDPRYSEPAIRQTLFILSGQAVLTAQSTSNIRTQTLCFATQQPDMVKHHTHVFLDYLHVCQPLFSGYGTRQYQQHLEAQLEVMKKANRIISVMQQPEADFLPDTAQARIFRMLQQSTDLKDSFLSSFFSQKRAQQSSEKIGLLSLDWLDKAVRDKAAAVHSDCDLFLREPVQLTGEETRQWLLQVIRQLEDNPNYHLYLIDTSADLKTNAHCFRYYERHCTGFASFPGENPFVISIAESNCLYALGLYLEQIITRIPLAHKDRNTVMQILADAADQLGRQANH